MNLKIKSKKVNEFTYELSIVAKWKDIQADFELCKKKIAKDIKVPGFRKGKIPDHILMSQYLGQIEMNFVQDFSEKYYILALQKEELNPINQAALKDIDFEYEKDFSFKSEFEIEPPLSVPKLKKNMVTVEKTNFISNQKEIEDTVNNILNSQSKTEKIEESSAEGDFMIASFQEVDEAGIAIIGKKEKKYIAIGQEPFTNNNKELLLNKKIGDTVKMNVDLGSGSKDYSIAIESMQRRVPPKLNEEFVKTMDPNCKSVEEWKSNIEKSISLEYEKKSEELFNSAIIDQFIKLVDPILPLSMLDSYLANIVKEVKTNENMQNVEDDKIKEEYKLFAENNLKWYLLRKAMIKDLNISINEKAVDNFIKEAIEKNDSQKAEIERFYKKESNKSKLADDLLDQQILDMLKEHSKVKEKDTNTADLHAGHNHP
ncbi:MAG: trigger factor [Candidatus Marinimicrobia bacterium]|jgi:trigger factor|nr:trigger factor [Candidatus Neomarinimicrobiota bacterium]MBT3727828.1 trigger factor [Candidatus Neomarinimicrobiota bacterium]MBT3943923.1 trigger factor [Candidatus Neomarinimicrobiota bacterium]MBT4706566.1 trigger factor [Candidatus Neomarinimicrobiota bacterium]MBT4926441.1 trigger factor [Candidatus Neomarinimicrobiota bacterium]